MHYSFGAVEGEHPSSELLFPAQSILAEQIQQALALHARTAKLVIRS